MVNEPLIALPISAANHFLSTAFSAAEGSAYPVPAMAAKTAATGAYHIQIKGHETEQELAVALYGAADSSRAYGAASTAEEEEHLLRLALHASVRDEQERRARVQEEQEARLALEASMRSEDERKARALAAEVEEREARVALEESVQSESERKRRLLREREAREEEERLAVSASLTEQETERRLAAADAHAFALARELSESEIDERNQRRARELERLWGGQRRGDAVPMASSIRRMMDGSSTSFVTTSTAPSVSSS